MDIVELDRRALAAAGQMVALVSADQLGNPTPCSQWALRDLLRHLVADNHGFAAAASGDQPAESVWAGSPCGDQPYPAYQEAAALVSGAFAAEGALGRQIELPGLGTFPAPTAISFHFVDYLIHSWDVAKAIGVPAGLDSDLVRTAVGFASHWPDTPEVRGPGALFGPRLQVPAGAPPLDQLLGALGRSPAWTTP